MRLCDYHSYSYRRLQQTKHPPEKHDGPAMMTRKMMMNPTNLNKHTKQGVRAYAITFSTYSTSCV